MFAQLYSNAVGSGWLQESCIRWGSRSAHAEQFLAERTCPGMPEDNRRWAVQNGTTDRDAVWFLDLGGPNEAAAMRPYVKLLWPLVIILDWPIKHKKQHGYTAILRDQNCQYYPLPFVKSQLKKPQKQLWYRPMVNMYSYTYTVNQKKRGSLFLTITLANFNRFL